MVTAHDDQAKHREMHHAALLERRRRGEHRRDETGGRRQIRLAWSMVPDGFRYVTTATSTAAAVPQVRDHRTSRSTPSVLESVTDAERPHRVELFGEPIVLWYDHQHKAWSAMLDQCPHRLAPLSEGRVDEEGQIECPYHGWTVGQYLLL